MATPNADEAKLVETQENKGDQVPADSKTLPQTQVAPAETDETVPAKKSASDEGSEETETPEKAVKTPETEELTEEDEKLLSERAQKRIRQLSEKAKRAEELEKEVDRLRSTQEQRFTQTVGEPRGYQQPTVPASPVAQVSTPQSVPTNLPWAENPDEERVVTPEEYKRELLSTADALVQARMSQYAKATEIKDDLERVERKYTELNPESPDYSEDLSVKLSNLFSTQLSANPQVRLSGFVDDIMSLRKSGEEKVKEQVSAKVVEQKSEEAILPKAVESEPTKPFESMTLDEKENYMREHGLW